MFAADFQSGMTLTPLLGLPTFIDVTTASPSVFNSDSGVIASVLVACNGIIHVLDGLLNDELRRRKRNLQ